MHDLIARALLESDTIHIQPNNPIQFRSGIISPVYVDNRRLPFSPRQWRVVLEGMRDLIEENDLANEIIAGVAMGGVPHSAALGYLLQRPTVFVRKESKAHGERKLVEGGDVSGRKVLLVEDLITTGTSSLSAVATLREGGAEVSDVLCIVSYGFDEAKQAFEQANVRQHTLTDFNSLLDYLITQNQMTEDNADMVRDWFADPHGWAARHGHA